MSYLLARGDLDELLTAIRRQGYRLIGPVLADGAICYGDIGSSADLPAGWTEEQDAGTYRLLRRDDQALFGYTVGPQSPKKYLFPSSSPLRPAPEKFAFIGVRACDLHAIAIQDRVLMGGKHPDPLYAARREGAFIVAVNCGQAASTCFCVSAGTGPRAESGFDLALTELLEDGPHRFIVETGSPSGEEIMAGLTAARPAPASDLERAAAVSERTAAQMTRSLPSADLRDLLYANMEHPRWDDVASRCLTCGNCTMVCPTCFCFSVGEVTALHPGGSALHPGGSALDPGGRERHWDSCFTLGHSYIHGGPARVSAKSRYRQWMTHKLATWVDQFGTQGCVGCGRCIAWCPVGIDITEEVRAIAEDA